MLASPQFGIHIPFWVMLFLASGIAALFGILLGAPTLRLRGDYLAIVTLGFGEIVPQTFLNLSQWTGGPNGIGSLDQPAIFGYRFGFDGAAVLLLDPGADRGRGARARTTCARAASAAPGWRFAKTNSPPRTSASTRRATKLAAFAIGASFSGLAGCAYASKLQLVSPDQFGFNVSVRGALDARARRDGQHPGRDRRQPRDLVARPLHLAAALEPAAECSASRST